MAKSHSVKPTGCDVVLLVGSEPIPLGIDARPSATIPKQKVQNRPNITTSTKVFSHEKMMPTKPKHSESSDEPLGVSSFT
jgi:hypothetical protein